MSLLRRRKAAIRLLAAALAAAGLLAGSGCVDRLLRIRSEPSGAEVFINGDRAGVTPLEHRFDFYGTFDVTLRAPGWVSTHHLEPIRAPWYEVMPIDFFSENLIPFRIRDRREIHYVLDRSPEGRHDRAEADAAAERSRALEGKIGGAEAGAEKAPAGAPGT
jgi:hypothetical protein